MLRFLGVFVPSVAAVAVVLLSAYVFANRLVDRAPEPAAARMSVPMVAQRMLRPRMSRKAMALPSSR